jgi:repressor LexA
MPKFKHHHLNREERIIEALKFIDQFSREFGYSPSVREIAEQMGVASSSTVAKMVNNMTRQGYLNQSNRFSKNGSRIARAIRISEKGHELIG